MRVDVRAFLAGAAVAVFALALPRSSEAGFIDVNSTVFQGVRVGFHLDGAFEEIENELGHGPIAVIGSMLMSNAVDVEGIDPGAVFEAYCVDILGSIEPFAATHVAAVGEPMAGWTAAPGLPQALNGGANAASLYNHFNPLIEFAASSAAFSFGSIETTADVARTALAMAIWNQLYDGDGSVAMGSGAFYVECDSTNDPVNGSGCLSGDGTIVQLANLFMHTAAGSTSATWIRINDPVLGDLQDFVGPGSVQPVPEPSALGLFGLGVAAAAIARRRKDPAPRLVSHFIPPSRPAI